MGTSIRHDGARRSVASYSSYGEAERAVDRLSDAGFPVEHVAIVGSGLRTVEQVTSRMTTGRAAAMGAGQGAIIGLFFALLFGIFFTGPNFFGLLVYAVVLAAIFGAGFGAVAHAATGGRRDFASFQRMEAERYEVMVDPDFAARAIQIIEGQAAVPPPATDQPAAPSAPAGDQPAPSAPTDQPPPSAPTDEPTPPAKDPGTSRPIDPPA